jgi:hypothetical protein
LIHLLLVVCMSRLRKCVFFGFSALLLCPFDIYFPSVFVSLFWFEGVINNLFLISSFLSWSTLVETLTFLLILLLNSVLFLLLEHPHCNTTENYLGSCNLIKILYCLFRSCLFCHFKITAKLSFSASISCYYIKMYVKERRALGSVLKWREW